MGQQYALWAVCADGKQKGPAHDQQSDAVTAAAKLSKRWNEVQVVPVSPSGRLLFNETTHHWVMGRKVNY